MSKSKKAHNYRNISKSDFCFFKFKSLSLRHLESKKSP